jgi:hypothetical protein
VQHHAGNEASAELVSKPREVAFDRLSVELDVVALSRMLAQAAVFRIQARSRRV